MFRITFAMLILAVSIGASAGKTVGASGCKVVGYMESSGFFVVPSDDTKSEEDMTAEEKNQCVLEACTAGRVLPDPSIPDDQKIAVVRKACESVIEAANAAAGVKGTWDNSAGKVRSGNYSPGN